MGWGGGGFGGGGAMFGGSASAASGRAGLPFGGIPEELMEEATKLLASEPVHPKSHVHFTQLPSEKERERLTLPRLLRVYPKWVVAGSALVIIISLTLQAGPLLTEFAISHGMQRHKSLSVIVVCAALYFGPRVRQRLPAATQVDVTGKLSSRVMHDLRIRVFTHFQRLSLDFFTEEKAGVLMSRMTSDIENLQQLIQDGISSVRAAGPHDDRHHGHLLQVTNVELAAWTDPAHRAPAVRSFSIWFHHASEKGYLLARDRIANVLADLSESLYGIAS
jgi:ATP-binding cassette subfamily B protein